MTPTARSLSHLRKHGYVADVAEKWIPATRQRRDLFGFADIVALGMDEVIFVQTTSNTNVAARVGKIAEHENTPHVRKAGVRIVVHGWAKRKGRWMLREVDLS